MVLGTESLEWLGHMWGADGRGGGTDSAQELTRQRAESGLYSCPCWLLSLMVATLLVSVQMGRSHSLLEF